MKVSSASISTNAKPGIHLLAKVLNEIVQLCTVCIVQVFLIACGFLFSWNTKFYQSENFPTSHN